MPLVGIVGRLFPIKNHPLFLESAVRVLKREPAARFVIVGDGTLRSELERQAREFGITDRVFFTGWQRDMPRIYADLDVLVVSSDNEGTPVSAIEAMATGCPVVATKVGGLPDLISDGESGLLVPPRNPDALSNAVLRVLEDSEAAGRMSAAARQSVHQRYTRTHLLAETDRLYANLLAQKGRSTQTVH
jgi:glycosyltransferase involved in cell wall biosynthesis